MATVFQEGGTKFVPLETRLHIVDLSKTESRRCSIKKSPKGTPRMFFPLYNGVALLIYVPTRSFKLMALWNIMVEEDLHSKNNSVKIKQTSHPV